jgi:hypothetical protein
MAYLESSLFAWTLGIIQIVGLASAWLARLSEGSPRQASCQRIFFACLGLIGLATMLSVTLGPRYWITTCTTLAVMVVGTIWDFRAEAGTESL